jgi:hypothetical protein
MTDPALIFLNDQAAGTHVLLIGVGHYAYGRGGASHIPGTVAEDLAQLTSAPRSAFALADWFIQSFDHRAKPLASLSMLISDTSPAVCEPKPQTGVANTAPPTGGIPGRYALPLADFAAVKAATFAWSERLKTNSANMGVFYFCGHGISAGQEAALLLRDFGEPGRELDKAIDVNLLIGPMRNSPAVQQLFLLDCCRTRADDLYVGQPNIGGRIVAPLARNRGHQMGTQQCVLFATLAGEEAFGIRGARAYSRAPSSTR